MAAAVVTRVALALLVGVVAMTTSVESRCQVSPQFWCDTYEIAEQCGVLEQCGQFSKWSSAGQPVEVGLYYESLCPGCRAFIADQLYPTYEKIGKIMNISLYPYGRADERLHDNLWQFNCQHGRQECVGNIIETCAIAQLQTFDVYFPFIHCFEGSLHDANVEPAAAKCAADLKIDFAPILACTKSSRGNALEHLMALKTEALTLHYVPWITVNQVHTESQQTAAQTDLLKVVCDTYTGSPKPDACTSATKKSFRQQA